MMMMPRIAACYNLLAVVVVVFLLNFRSSWAFQPTTTGGSSSSSSQHLPQNNVVVFLKRRLPSIIACKAALGNNQQQSSADSSTSSSTLVVPVRKPENVTAAIISSSPAISSTTTRQEEESLETRKTRTDGDVLYNLNFSSSDNTIKSSTTSGSSSSTETQDADEQQRIASSKTIMLSLLWTVAALSALDRVAMSVALVPMADEFGFTDSMKGSISSLFSVGYGVGILPAGLLVANASPRVIMACGVTVWSLATIVTPTTAPLVAATMIPLLAARAAVGSAESVVMPTMQRLLAAWTQPQEKSLILAIVFSGFQMGTIAAYLLSPVIMDYFGDWRELFYVYGAFGLALLVPWLLFAKDSPKALALQDAIDTTTSTTLDDTVNQAITETSITASSQQSTTSATKKWEESIQVFRDAPWRDFAKSPGVWAMLLAHCSKNWGLYNTLAWTPTFYSEQYGIGVRDSAWLSVLPSVAGMAGGFLAGNLADALLRYYSSRNEMNEETLTNVRKLFQSVALFGPALALGTLAMDIPTDPVVAQCFLMVAVGLQAFTASGFESANQEKAGEKWAGLLYSVTSLPAVMVGTAGVYTVGQILDATGQDWSIVFGLNAIVNILGGAAFLALYNSRREFD